METDYDYYSSYDGSIAMLAGLMGFMMVISLIGYVFTSVAMMIMLKRAGHPRAWSAWVPFYNTYILYQFGGQKSYWFWIYLASAFISVIPLIGPFIGFIGSIFATIAMVYAFIFINKSFGKQNDLVLWTLFAVFLFPIWALVIGLSKNTSDYMPAYSPILFAKEGDPPPIVW